MAGIVPHQCKPCAKKIDSRDNFVASQSYVISSATGRKYLIRWDSTCSTPSVVYMTYYRKCEKQVFLSTISWKPRLHNYNSHIKKNVRSYKIPAHFIDESCDEEIRIKYLAFFIIYMVNDPFRLTRNQTEDLLLE